MFWRKANMQIIYLEECYKNNNIGLNSKNNKPNFNPLIKLVFNMTISKGKSANRLANGITAIDKEFIKNPQVYKNNNGIEDLARMKAQIENEESGLLTGYGKYKGYSNFNKNSRRANNERNEFNLLNDKLRKYP